jgi:hypothetical protein
MADILIRGGNAEAAAKAMCAAVSEIFETEPIQSTVGGSLPDMRGLWEVAAVIVGIPPGIYYGRKIVEDGILGRWRRLIARAEKEEKATGARLMIDVGDSKPIPLHQANYDKIQEALVEFEKHWRNKEK